MNQTLNKDVQAAPLRRKQKISDIEPDVAQTLSVRPEEREAIKALLDLEGLERFDFTYRIRVDTKGRVHVSGRLEADLVQTCVVTLEPVPAAIDVPVEAEFWPAPMIAELERKAEDPHRADLIDWPEAIDGEAIDLGPLVYETLATSLEPYPKKPGASFTWSDADAKDEELENGPFAGLKGLKKS